MITRYDHKASEGLIKCLYIDFKRFRVLIALSETVWYTKGKKQLIPISFDGNQLFVYKLALGIRKK